MSPTEYTIGFAGLSEEADFPVIVRRSLEQAAAEYPNINLIVRDNNMDDATALANIEEFASIPVDLAMIYHLGERVGPTLSSTLLKKKIKMIAVDIPIPPWAVYFGVNNHESGSIVGEELAKWINTYWEGQVEKVLVLTESRVLDFVRARSTSALDALIAGLGYTPSDIMYLEGGNTREASIQAVTNILHRWPDVHRIAVIGFNDETAAGALDAARDLGREQDMVAVGQGGNLIEELERPNSRMIASVAYNPEHYGHQLMSLALRMLTGERVARENYIDNQRLTAASLPYLR
ncbi:MAG: sugar ABC transporter substrate-binding protein [Chloroflexota bacterium]